MSLTWVLRRRGTMANIAKACSMMMGVSVKSSDGGFVVDIGGACTLARKF